MFSSARNRARELYFFDRFRDLWPGCPGTIACVQERPDCIFAPTSTPLGIEVTEIFRSRSEDGRLLQEQEALRERVGREAERMHADRGLEPLHVSIHVQSRTPIAKRDVRRLAASLVDIAASLDIPPVAVVRYPADDDWRTRLPPPVRSLTIARSPALTRPSWSVASAAWIPTLSVKQVEDVIRRKERTSRQNLPSGYRCWLLLVIGGPGLASSFSVPDSLLAREYTSDFDRLFLMDCLRGLIWPLRGEVSGRSVATAP